MVLLISGASHTGKTVLAQKILEKYKFPYLSVDHLKMGLIRSGQTELTAKDDNKLTVFLWPIVREIIKTAIENRQNLTVEGCYFPAGWEKDFSEEYLAEIRFLCLIMTETYIRNHFSEICRHANDIECRVDDSSCNINWLIQENRHFLNICQENHYPCRLIEEEYNADFEL